MADANATAWVCTVCGYVHRGPEPPDTCAVCGAGRDAFERKQDEAPKHAAAAGAWHCLICGYDAQGAGPPAECPVCGAGDEDFQPQGGGEAPKACGQAVKAVIVGGGIAAVSAAEALREASPEAEIILVSKEPDLPYYRLNLTRYLANEVKADALPLHPEAWYGDQRIDLRRGAEVTGVLPHEKTVEIDHKHTESFDKLILACGAHPFIPPIPGAARQGVSGLRTLAEADALIDALCDGTPSAVIGGGVLGLETAVGLGRHGGEVTVLEGFGWLLPRQLNPEAGALLARRVKDLGIDIKCGVKTQELVGDERVQGIVFEDDASMNAFQVVMATGVRPNSYLARRAGLEVNRGVAVDGRLRTSCPDILAAGDLAEHQGMVYGLWEPARYQGVIAGMSAAGLDAEFGGMPRTNTLKVLGIGLFSIGDVMPQDGSYLELSRELDGDYARFLFRDNRLAGAILIGDTHLAATLSAAVKNAQDFSDLLRLHPNADEVVQHLRELAG